MNKAKKILNTISGILILALTACFAQLLSQQIENGIDDHSTLLFVCAFTAITATLTIHHYLKTKLFTIPRRSINPQMHAMFIPIMYLTPAALTLTNGTLYLILTMPPAIAEPWQAIPAITCLISLAWIVFFACQQINLIIIAVHTIALNECRIFLHNHSVPLIDVARGKFYFDPNNLDQIKEVDPFRQSKDEIAAGMQRLIAILNGQATTKAK